MLFNSTNIYVVQKYKPNHSINLVHFDACVKGKNILFCRLGKNGIVYIFIKFNFFHRYYRRAHW